MQTPTSHPGSPWTAANTRAQFRAVAVLRWRIFRNNLRRKSSKGDLIANIIFIPIFFGFTFGPAVGAGFASFYAVSSNHPAYLTAVLWAIFAIGQFTSIQLGQPETVFDPTQLIRFPLAFRGYAFLRVFFGLIGPSNFVVTFGCLAVIIGVSLAAPALAPWVFCAMAAFLLANIFFTRMVFSWVDRWLSTRRAREVFTGFIFVFSLGIQWANFSFTPAYSHTRASAAQVAARIHTAQHLYATAKPVLDILPPALVIRSLTRASLGDPLTAILLIAGVLVFAAIFFAIFAIRLHREFRGENLSDAANAIPTATTVKPASRSHVSTPALSLDATITLTPPANPIPLLLGKEVLTLRRTTGIFYAILAPLVLVVLFVSKLSARTPAWFLFPACVAYTLFGVLPLAYNTLGMEAAGVQFYFLAPLGMRPVMIAKNIMTGALVLIEVLTVFASITIAGHAPSPGLTVAVLLWTLAASLISFSVGNGRSIAAPKKIDPAKAAGKQASPLSALIALGILLLLMAYGAAALVAAHLLDKPWILLPAMLVLTAIAVPIYLSALRRTDRNVARHRDTLIEILCKGG